MEDMELRKRRGRPPKAEGVDQEPEDQMPEPTEQTVTVASKEDDVIRKAVEGTKHLSEDDINRQIIGLEKQGELYDIVRNTYELMLPDELQALHDKDRYRFRWLDSTDPDSFFTQQHRKVFKWTLVNRMFPGCKLPRGYFDSNGAISRSRLVLAYMPFPLWKKWQEIKQQVANEKFGQRSRAMGKDFYDPAARGENVDFSTPATSERFSGLVHEVQEKHSDVIFEEQGEYV